jgi:hypothetical protein
MLYPAEESSSGIAAFRAVFFAPASSAAKRYIAVDCGRVNYNFAEKYLRQLAVRNTKSSLF